MSDRTLLHIEEIVKEAPHTITIHFAQPEQAFSYLSGRFLTLICDVGGKEERRSYSLCSSPYVDKQLSITIKRVKGGKMSNYLIDNLKAGDKIAVLPPVGNFTYKPQDASRQIVLIGGGSGITPLFSIIKSALVHEPNSTVSLIYVNSCREHTIFYEQLESWSSKYESRFRVVHYWSDRQPNTGFFYRLFSKKNNHRINAARLKSIFEDLAIGKEHNSEFYLCGPQGLMEMATSTIRKIGFPKEIIHKELFHAAEQAENSSAKPSQEHLVKILFKGKEHQVGVATGTTVLFAGLEHGIDLPYSCQNGSCNSCAAKCISGKIAMSTTEGLTEEQIKNGYVLTCVGYPQSDDVVIDVS